MTLRGERNFSNELIKRLLAEYKKPWICEFCKITVLRNIEINAQFQLADSALK